MKESVSCSVMSDSLQPHGLWPVHARILQARILEWVAISFSRESSWPRGPSWPRGWTQISCIASRFFTVWATTAIQRHNSGTCLLATFLGFVTHTVAKSDYIISCTTACQAPLSMEFSRQEYWSEWPFPSPGDHPDPGIKPGSLALQADSLPSEPPGKPT